MCFHLADEKTEGQKGGMICSRSHKARGQSEHGAQAFRLLHACRLTLQCAPSVLPAIAPSASTQTETKVHFATLG